MSYTTLPGTWSPPRPHHLGSTRPDHRFKSTPHAAADRWALYDGEDLDRATWTIGSSAAGGDRLAELTSTATTLVAAPTPAPAAPTARRTATATAAAVTGSTPTHRLDAPRDT